MLTTNHLPAPAPPLSLSPVAVSSVASSPPDDRFADLDAERRLLAAVLRDPALLPPLVGSVIVSEFSLVAHRHIFAACLDLCDQSSGFSLSALETTLECQNHPDSLAIVRDLQASPPAPLMPPLTVKPDSPATSIASAIKLKNAACSNGSKPLTPDSSTVPR